MNKLNKYKEYSVEKVRIYKSKFDKDFFLGVSLIDTSEVLFIISGIFIFLSSWQVFKVVFIVVFLIFYWFKIKWVEGKIIEAKQNLILGSKFLNEDFRGRGVTTAGVEPYYKSHESGFGSYIDFLEIQRNHLVARLVILNLFALVLLEIIRIK